MPGLLDMLMFQNQPMADAPMGMLGGAPNATPMLPFRDRFSPMTNAQEYGTATSGPAGPAGNPLANMPGMSMPPNASPTVGRMPAPIPAAPPTSPDVTAPAAGAPSPQGAAASIPGTSLLGRVGETLGNHPQTLMKMAAGFLGAPTLGQGASRALAGGAEGLKDDQQKLAMKDTYQALVKAGVPPAHAMAAITAQQGGNASLLAGLAAKHFGPQHLMNVGNQLRDPNSGALAGQGPAELVTIKDPTTGMDTSALKHPDGRIERINPGSVPTAGQPPVQVQRIEDALKLPPGTQFVDPYGMVRTR